MTFDEFKRRVGEFLFDQWVPRAGLTEDTLRGFFAHGIPSEWARAIADGLRGTIPVADWPKLIHPPRSLTRGRPSVKLNKPVTSEHKFNIARGQKPGDKFLQAITAKQYTQTSLAAALGITPALMSMYRRKDEPRPIPLERAEKVEELTGWKASARNWPGGIVS